MEELKENLGEGWIYYQIKEVYEFNNGEFCITADIVKKRCLNLGRPYVKSVHLIPNLNYFYRMHMGYPNEPEKLIRDIKSRNICANCGQQIDRPVENAEEKLKMATSFETGKGIYYSALDHKFRSIDLCNWCYSVMQAYRYSLSKEDRLEKENRSNSSQG